MHTLISSSWDGKGLERLVWCWTQPIIPRVESYESLRASIASVALSHGWSWNIVKRFFKIVENHPQEFLLFSALFLDFCLTDKIIFLALKPHWFSGEDVVWQGQGATEKDLGEDLPCDEQERIYTVKKGLKRLWKPQTFQSLFWRWWRYSWWNPPFPKSVGDDQDSFLRGNPPYLISSKKKESITLRQHTGNYPK